MNVPEICGETFSSRAREMAQKLRVCTALTEAPSWVPSTHTGSFATAYHSRSWGSDTLMQALIQHTQLE